MLIQSGLALTISSHPTPQLPSPQLLPSTHDNQDDLTSVQSFLGCTLHGLHYVLYVYYKNPTRFKETLATAIKIKGYTKG